MGVGRLTTLEGVPVSLGAVSDPYASYDWFLADSKQKHEAAAAEMQKKAGPDWGGLVDGLLKVGTSVGTSLINSYTAQRIAKGASRAQAAEEANAAANYARAVERGEASGPSMLGNMGGPLVLLALLGLGLAFAMKGR